MRVVAISNQKGGVGKTTSALLLASALQHRGARVLLIDSDPQASATKVLGIDTSSAPSFADAMLSPADFVLSDVIVSCDWGFDVAPSEIVLAQKDSLREVAQEFTLRKLLDDVRVTGAYDIVLIDCPPSLGALTVNALTAADDVLIVTEPGLLALQGLSDLLDTIALVREHYNAELRIANVLVNQLERTRVAGDRLAEARAFFDDGLVFELPIPRFVVVKEAIEDGADLYALATSGRSAHRPRAQRVLEIFETLAERISDGSPTRA